MRCWWDADEMLMICWWYADEMLMRCCEMLDTEEISAGTCGDDGAMPMRLLWGQYEATVRLLWGYYEATMRLWCYYDATMKLLCGYDANVLCFTAYVLRARVFTVNLSPPSPPASRLEWLRCGYDFGMILLSCHYEATYHYGLWRYSETALELLWGYYKVTTRLW